MCIRPWFLGLLALLCLITGQAHSATPAGVSIENQAQVEYFDTATGQDVVVLSNVSSVVVKELRRFILEPELQLSVVSGQRVTLAHQLSNVGNIEDSYNISVLQPDTSSIRLIDPRVFVDLNNNGIVDSNEPTLGNTHVLQPGEKISVLITGDVPVDAYSRPGFDVQLQAVSSHSGVAPVVVVDRLEPLAPSDLSLVLESSQSCQVAVPAEQVITYQVTLQNNALTTPVSRTVSIDGELRNGVLLEMGIPADLQLLRSQLPSIDVSGAALVLQLVGQADEWISQRTWNGVSEVERAAVLLPSSALQTEDEVLWRVPATFRNNVRPDTQVSIAAKVDINGDSTVGDMGEFESNSVCNSVNQISEDTARIRFLEPSSTLLRSGEQPDFYSDEDFADTTVYRLDSYGDYRIERDGVYIELRADVPEDLQLKDVNGAHYVFVDVYVVPDRVSAERTRKNKDNGTRVLLRQVMTGGNLYRSVRSLRLSQNVGVDQPSACPVDAQSLQTLFVSGGVVDPAFDETSDTCTLHANPNDWLSGF